MTRAKHIRSGSYVEYIYNDQKQLTSKKLFNGMEVLRTTPDLRGRANESVDVRGNSITKSFDMNDTGTVRTTQTTDPQITDSKFVPWRIKPL